jgi:hypothetical protein
MLSLLSRIFIMTSVFCELFEIHVSLLNHVVFKLYNISIHSILLYYKYQIMHHLMVHVFIIQIV